jgi:hypothetical protein
MGRCSVVWEIGAGHPILPAGSLPEVRAGEFDAPDRLAALLDAVRWSAVTSRCDPERGVTVRSGGS